MSSPTTVVVHYPPHAYPPQSYIPPSYPHSPPPPSYSPFGPAPTLILAHSAPENPHPSPPPTTTTTTTTTTQDNTSAPVDMISNAELEDQLAVLRKENAKLQAELILSRGR